MHWRTFMKSLNRKLDQERKILDDMDVDFLDGADQLDDIKRISEDLYYVLVEKTEGDAALRVNSGETGEGLKAYMRLNPVVRGYHRAGADREDSRAHAPRPSQA